MCGILGSINIPFDLSLLNTIKHRGPDDYGIERINISSSFVTFGHRRLSIVDLSPAGHQPMMSDCRNYMIAFNGEIYNHLELRDALPKSLKFQGHSDTETILYYIKQFGITAIKDFNGIFALAFLDIRSQILYLARDRFGIKPLYYYLNSGKLLFASELRAITKICNPEIDLESLVDCLGIRYFPSPITPFKGVCKLEPGHLISISIKKNKFNNASFIDTQPVIGYNRSEYSSLVNTYGDLFIKAVERQLMADVEVGVLLSGGIDSALVAAVAQQKSPKKVKAFTIGFDERYSEIDETSYAVETAELLGLDHFCRVCNFQDFLGSLRNVVDIIEEPLGTTSIIPMYFLSELASSKVKVVLSGQGADEPLGGYNKYRALPLLALMRKRKFVRNIFRYFKPLLQKKESLRRFTSAVSENDDIDSYIKYNTISSFEEIYKIINRSSFDGVIDEPNLRKQQFFKNIKASSPDNSDIKDLFLYLDLRTSLADDLLMYTDKITMHFGLECRVPLLDNDLIEFIESLHSSRKYNTWGGKLIHKSFAQDYLPSNIINRKKMGFNSPTKDWFRKNNEEILQILNSNALFSELFSMAKVNSLIRSHLMKRNMEKQIFLLLTISCFLDQVNNQTEMAQPQHFTIPVF